MSQNHLFSSGLELANLVVSSGVLYHSWAAVRDLYSEINQNEQPSLSVRYKISQQPNCTTIAFFTWSACSKDYIIQGGGGEDLVSSSTLKESFPLFEFLCTKTNPKFSINKAALELFASIRDSLPSLKSQIDNSKVLIITGKSLGGSVATLFTLWLLETIDFSITKRPLCITFGSPLIGDNGLQNAILEYPTWNSCFLHVVSDQDPVPRVLISPHNPPATESASQTNVYKPFGTFLLYSEFGCGCFKDSQTILELLMATYSEGPGNQNSNQVLELYKKIVEFLNRKVICGDTTGLLQWTTPPLRAGIIIQLVAIGLMRPQSLQPQGQNNGLDNLITKIEKQEMELVMSKGLGFNPSKTLNEIKINMAFFEWYKKCFKEKGIGYYDSFKNGSSQTDIEVVKFKTILAHYWEGEVNEAEKKPQKEGAPFRTGWLGAGTNFRRMIEPLDIAEYYKKGLKDYINQGRPKHYKQLEQWLKVTEKTASNPSQLKKQNVASSLTEDSCFWAHVEEALISCKLLSSRESSTGEKELSKHNLIEFENYVLSLMKNYAVSPEIFLPQSSFMLWWKEYEEIIRKGIMGASYYSPLTDLMKNRSYQNYATGDLEIP
ncbi:senescence-associated carboxylesterase 101-like isoform X1 [Quercus suber]|uniref:senescence-associated carboxylesterase 101-like isoform X1 n=1 Tax=Quercus suber TaxID=58331 RepID=UPI0032DE51DF